MGYHRALSRIAMVTAQPYGQGKAFALIGEQNPLRILLMKNMSSLDYIAASHWRLCNRLEQ